MKTMRLSVLACCLAASNLLAEETMDLRDLVTNTEKPGFVLLSQGYRGRLTKSFSEPKKPAEPPIDFEFTHGVLNQSRQEDGASTPQRIAIRISTPAYSDLKLYGSFATFYEKIPDFETLCDLNKIQDFEKLFGKSKGHNPAWKFDGNLAYHTMSWTLFTILTDQTIRVVEASVDIGKSNTEFKILERRIQEGIFHATGKAPVFEQQNRNKDEQ
jgi:hypothetical protein